MLAGVRVSDSAATLALAVPALVRIALELAAAAFNWITCVPALVSGFSAMAARLAVLRSLYVSFEAGSGDAYGDTGGECVASVPLVRSDVPSCPLWESSGL